MRFGQFGGMIVVASLLVGAAVPARGSEDGAAAVIPLWEKGAPGPKATDEVPEPTLILYPAPKEKANGAAIVVCPGGGYSNLAMDHEGHDIARWLNNEGIGAFIVTYRRRPPFHHPIPLGDAQRATRIVRSRAGEWNVDPNKIGILGFSAGGHLASTAGTHFDAGEAKASDPIDRASCRPDFMVLIYPVVMFDSEFTHRGSQTNLLGENPDPALVELLSNEKQVTAETPPTFMVHTYNDSGVPAENSVYFYLALRKAGVPAELHLYEPGKHGFGLAPGDPVLSTWPPACIAWLRTRGIVE